MSKLLRSSRVIPLSDPVTQKIISLYESGKSMAFISKKVNLSPTAVYARLKRNNIQIVKGFKKDTILKRKFEIHHDYFKEVDLSDKAYFLGLLYADGYNHSKKNRIVLSLQEEDKYIIERVIANIFVEKRSVAVYKRISSNKNVARIVITSKQICKDLTRLGCVQNKSLILKFPTNEQVSKDLQSHFIRGYFDGDGSIGIYKNHKNLIKKLNFVGTFQFLYELQNIIVNELGVTLVKIRPNKSIFSINFTRKKDLIKIRDYLYKNKEDLYLTRKYKIFNL